MKEEGKLGLSRRPETRDATFNSSVVRLPGPIRRRLGRVAMAAGLQAQVYLMAARRLLASCNTMGYRVRTRTGARYRAPRPSGRPAGPSQPTW